MIDVPTACYILPHFNKLNHAPELILVGVCVGVVLSCGCRVFRRVVCALCGVWWLVVAPAQLPDVEGKSVGRAGSGRRPVVT